MFGYVSPAQAAFVYIFIFSVIFGMGSCTSCVYQKYAPKFHIEVVRDK